MDIELWQQSLCNISNKILKVENIASGSAHDWTLQTGDN